MNTREWALLAFTILGQLAVGALLVLMIVRTYFASKVGAEEADQMTNGPLFMVVPIMGLALLASLLHLNNPINIVRAVPNLDSSWLSREVVISVVFVIMAALFTLMQWRKLGTNIQRTVVGWATALIGLVQTYAMGMVYMIRTQPAWDTLATPVTFFVTTLLLGVLAVAVAQVTSYTLLKKKDAKAAEKQSGMLRDSLQGIAITAIILLGIEFIVMPIYMAFLATQGSAALESLKLMTGSYGLTLAIRLLLVFLGAGVLATYMFRNAASAGKEKSLATLAYSAFLLVLVGEVMGRFLFYATQVRIGL
jgi:anaerobic dimethyl sulfoxide reductase subunit C (anchor subunit)